MRVVIQNMERLEIDFSNPDSKDKAQVILNVMANISTYEKCLPTEVVEAFTILWEDQGVRECFSRAYEYQLNDSAP